MGQDSLRAALRGLCLLAHLALGLVLALAVTVEGGRRLSAGRVARWWHGVLLGILDIQLTVRGEPRDGPQVLVANHVSWLDIPVLGSLVEARFVAKSEIRGWPVVGWLARTLGTFFIRRGRGGAGPVLAHCVPYLRSGGSMLFFPEGTTTEGRGLAPFHARLFAAAIEAEVPVQPVALRYGRTPDGRNIAPFIGDDDLVSHILRLLREPQLAVELSYAEPIRPGSLSRDDLALRAQESIRRIVAAPGAPPAAALKPQAVPA